MANISVIIPCYNCEKTLGEAVDSCYRQGLSETEFEIVMVDDASTDGTRALMESLAKKHSNISLVFHESNKGGGAARNTAIAHAKNEIIFCLDSDDLLGDGALSRMAKELKERNCDAVCIGTSIKFKDRDINDVAYVNTYDYGDRPVPISALFGEDTCPLYVVCMFTKRAHETLGGYPEDHGFDTQGFGFRFLMNGLTAYTCKDATYYHRVSFHKSYYLREYFSGKMNHNWYRILEEFLFMFDDATARAILAFDPNDRQQNLFEHIRVQREILRSDYRDYIGEHCLERYENNVRTGNPYDQYWLAVRRFKLGSFEKAQHLFEGAIPAIPESAYAHYYLRECVRHTGQKSAVLDEKLADAALAYKRKDSAAGLAYRAVTKAKRLAKKNRYTYAFAKAFLRGVIKPKYLYLLRSSTRPISTVYGFDRGTPIDRFYIERFLDATRSDVRGTCLELLDNAYTLRYGAERVTKSEILDIETSNLNATLIGDLRNLEGVPDASYDCIILTQVLQFIDDVDAAIAACYRILKPGGALLVTLPSVSRIDVVAGISGDYWRFTAAAANYLFEKRFERQNVTIQSHGNARAGSYFLAGLAQEDTSPKVLAPDDPNFPVIISVRAVK